MSWDQIIILAIPTLTIIIVAIILRQRLAFIQQQVQQMDTERDSIQQLIMQQQQAQHEQRQRFDEHQINSLKLIQDSFSQGLGLVRDQVTSTLTQHTETLSKRVDKLTDETQLRLKEIGGQVDRKLMEGFEKTTATFTDVIKRLTIIDEAQKKITELSTNVVSLQEILADKRTRGAFGEVQLSNLIHNMMPESHYALQHTLSNGKRCDCILFLPDPTGNIVIDAKFPLESYQQMYNNQLAENDRRQAEQQFRLDVKKHIRDIAEKYIIPGETAEGAIMFLPAEAVFAEIHAHYPDLIEVAHKSRVWLVSPTTMMAILTTASAVLKDAATRKQVHIIQEHLGALSKDFERFQKRMDNLVHHINLAHQDVSEVQQSSKKITSRFQKIEKVELEIEPVSNTLLTEE
jgi:DNA recombination protein RmuC